MSEVFNGNHGCKFEYDAEGMDEMICMKDAEGNIAYMDPQDVADWIEHNIIYEKGSLIKLMMKRTGAVIEKIEFRFTERMKDVIYGKTKQRSN